MKKKSLLLLIGFVVFTFYLSSCYCVSDRNPFSDERTFEKSYKFSSGGRLSLKNKNGEIYISAWDKEEVRILANIKVKASTRDLAREVAEKIEIEVDYDNDDMRISAYNPYRSGIRKINVNITYKLKVPKGINLDATTQNGLIEVENVDGETEVFTQNGRIVVDNARGTVEANTQNGSIKAEVAEADTSDRIKLKTQNGSIKLYLGEDVKADISAETQNGRIDTDFPITINRTYSRRRLEGTINGGGTSIILKTQNGSVKILKL